MLYTSRPVLETVIRNLELSMDYSGLKGMISIYNPIDTRLLNLTVESSDPILTKTIVDELAAVGSQYIGYIIEITPPKIIEKGEIPTVPSSPQIKKNTLMGALISGLLVCTVLILKIIFSSLIQSEEDIQNYLGMANLAVVPERKLESRKRKKG